MKKYLLFLVLYLLSLPLPAHASNSSKIRVLILEDSYTVPDRKEKLVMMGNTGSDLLVNGTHYTGKIEVWKGEKGLYLINELPLEEYVEDVVVSEVGQNWDIEALKAQAVISRTYAVFMKKQNANSRFDLTSSVLHQVYKGNSTSVQIAYAVRETAGEILTYEGNPIEAFYHSTSAGRTENPEEVFGKSYPYLKSVETDCELSPFWMWERKIPKEEIEKALGIKGLKDMTIHSLTSTERVKEVAVESESGETLVKATDLRKLLGWSRLPSTQFSLKVNGTSITFDGKGYGHGVGLCQWSALQMARDGKNYKEILSYFYPGTEIRLYEGD